MVSNSVALMQENREIKMSQDRHLLIVEDDKTIAPAMAAVAVELGYQVCFAETQRFLLQNRLPYPGRRLRQLHCHRLLCLPKCQQYRFRGLCPRSLKNQSLLLSRLSRQNLLQQCLHLL